jgi:hypothetical protein
MKEEWETGIQIDERNLGGYWLKKASMTLIN